jgi:hypothetical protein
MFVIAWQFDLDAVLAHLTTEEIRLGSFESGVSQAEVI